MSCYCWSGLVSDATVVVYIGKTASLTYLQFLRDVVKYRLGPCAFTEGGFNKFMLESHTVADSNSDTAINLDFSERNTLIQHFFDAVCLVTIEHQAWLINNQTSGILELFTRSELFQSTESNTEFINDAARDLALAIGAQCRGSHQGDLLTATTHFKRGQKAAFEGMLCDPTVDMVRTFLLMSFYMLGIDFYMSSSPDLSADS